GPGQMGPEILSKMIIHKLISYYRKHGDDARFYLMQAQDAVRWIESCGVKLGPGVRALDLGCGHGVFGAELAGKGCQVTYADADNYLQADIADSPFHKIDLDRE